MPTQPFDSTQYRFWRNFTVIAGGITLFPLFFYPLNSDTSALQWVAYQFQRFGKIPYIGTWEPNFPGVLPFHLLSVALFNRSEIGFRLIEVVFQLTTALFFYKLLLRWLSAPLSFFACLFYLLTYMHGNVTFYGQRDAFATGLFTIATYLYYSRPSSKWSTFFSGAIMGWAVLIRPLYIILPLTLILFSLNKHERKNAILLLSALTIPFLSSILFYLITGSIKDYYVTTILFLGKVYTAVPTQDWKSFFVALYWYWPIVVFPAIALLGYQLNLTSSVRQVLRQRKLLMLYVLMIIEVTGIIWIQHRFLAYHFALLLVLLSPLAALGVGQLLHFIRSTKLKIASASALMLALLVGFTPFLSVTKYVVSGRWHTMGYNGLNLVGDEKLRLQDDSVINYLAQPNNNTGIVEICSYDARLRWRLDREEATRFCEFQAVTARDANGSHPDFQQKWQKEFLNDVLKKPATFILLNGQTKFWTYLPPREGIQTDFPALDSLLRTDYVKDTVIGEYAIFRKRLS